MRWLLSSTILLGEPCAAGAAAWADAAPTGASASTGRASEDASSRPRIGVFMAYFFGVGFVGDGGVASASLPPAAGLSLPPPPNMYLPTIWIRSTAGVVNAI